MTVTESTLCLVTTEIPGVELKRMKFRVRPNDSVASFYNSIYTQMELTNIQVLLNQNFSSPLGVAESVRNSICLNII